MTDDEPKADLQAAIARFNQGDYFAAGESFETLAANSAAEAKALPEALNRIAAGLHLRFERGGRQAAINLLSQALIVLEDFRPARAGIDVDRLYEDINSFVGVVRSSPRDESAGLKHRARLMLERRRAPRINAIPES